MAESRNGSFYEGKTPALINVHEAYTSGKIAKEEAQDLNPKYAPEKVVGKYKNGGNKTQKHVYDDLVNQRKNKTGNYKPKGTTNNG